MPSYQDILNRHSAAIGNGLIDPNTSLEDYALQGAQATNDPSWLDVAEGGPVKNWIRTKNAQLNNLIEAGPIDDWSAAAVGQVGDLFGIDPQVSRDVGRSLPRGVVDMVPMVAGGALGLALGGPAGAAVGGRVGMGLTSGLSALNAYGNTGKVLDAAVGAAAPYVGTKLSEMGTKAILANAAKPDSVLGKLGFTGGTKVAGQALTAEEQVALAASKQFGTVAPEVLAKTTVDKTVVDLARDKFLGYVGGEAAANAGFTGLDIVTQGTDAVFNKNYLFANLISNVPFMAAEIPGAFRTRELDVKFNLPEAEKAYASEAEKRGYEAALMFQGLDAPASLAKYRSEGLEMADYVKGFQDISSALNERTTLREIEGPKFAQKWNDLVAQFPEMQMAPITGETNVAGLLRQMTAKDSNAPAQFADLARAHKNVLEAADAAFRGSMAKLNKLRDLSPRSLQDNYQLLADKLNVDTLMQKPVADRTLEDYTTALNGQISAKGVELVRDLHRVREGLEPESLSWQEFQQMRTDAGKVAYSPDQQLELTVAHAVATGNVPSFNHAAKKAKEVQDAGGTAREVSDAGLKVITEPKPARVKMTPEEKKARRAAAKAKKKVQADLEKVKELAGFRQLIADSVPEKLTTEPSADVPSHTLKAIQVMEKMGKEKGWTQSQANDFMFAAMKEFKAGKGTYEERFKRLMELEAGIKAVDQVRANAVYLDEVENSMIDNDGNVYHDEPTREQLEEVVDQLDEVPEVERKVPKAVRAVKDTEERLTQPTTPEEAKATSEQFKKSAYSANQLEAIFNHPKFEKLYRASRKNGAFEAAPYSKEEAIKWFHSLGKEQYKSVVKPLTEAGLVLPKRALKYAQLDSNGDYVAIPDPDVPIMQVRAFADAIAGKTVWSNPVERAQFVEQLPKIARLFNNPEVVYGELGLTQDSKLKFARLSAGGGFDFGLRPVVGGKIQREGKAPIGNKEGLLTEQELRTHGGVDNVTLTKGEVDFYRQLVPEAFNVGPEKKVDVQKLWDGLGKVGEQVKVVSYGQAKDVQVQKQQYDELTHEFWDTLSVPQRSLWLREASDAEYRQAGYSEQQIDDAHSYRELRNAMDEPSAGDQPFATSYYNSISPFDTKKFPVKRVDVVLPIERDAQGNRKFLDDLWIQDNLHENLPNTLGWAMVQIVPHPVTGEKVMFVGELQSRWAQSTRDSVKRIAELRANPSDAAYPSQLKTLERETPLHPLLPIHQNLILKSLIKEAQKQGISKIALSDGETAMMTEMHDRQSRVQDGGAVLALRERANRGEITEEQYTELRKQIPAQLKQEGGMRLAYDTTLPSIMSKLTGESGKLEDFGAHKNATVPFTGEARRFSTEAEATAYAEGGVVGPSDDGGWFGTKGQERGSPVFRTPSGTPKTNVTALTFDISNPSSRVGTLFAKGQGTIFGAASQQAKQIFLNSPAFRALDPLAQLLHVFAHEHSHVSLEKARNGEYGPDAQQRADKALKWSEQASPEALDDVLGVIRDMSHPDGVDLGEVERVLSNHEPEEWMANAHAFLVTGALRSTHPKEMFAFLPKPLRDVLDWSIATMQKLMKGVTTWAQLGFSLDKFQQVKTMEAYFDAVRKSFREAEFDAAEATKYLELGNPAMRQGQAEDFLLAQDTTGRPKFMTEPRQFLGTTWQKFVMGMGNLGRMYPVLQPAVDAVRKANDVKMDVNAHVMKIMYGTMSGTGKVIMDSPALTRVVGSPALKSLWNALSVHAEKEGNNILEMTAQPDGSVKMGFKDSALTPELRGRLKQFKPEAQQALLDTMANHQRANIALQKFLVEFEKQGASALIANAIFSLPSQKNKLGFEGAYGRAEALFDGVLAKDQVAISKALEGLDADEAATAVKMAEVYANSHEELKSFYDSRPSYMSLRRFKEFRQRITHETRGERDVIDAASSTELNKLLKKYTDAGWKVEGPVLRSSDKAAKEAFHVNDAVRDILERKEQKVREFVETANISDDVKADLMKQFNFVGELEHQVNAQNMYKPGSRREFAGDLSRFDVLEQFMHSVPASIAAASNAALNARVNFELRHPELQLQRTQKDQFLALFEQSKQPDGKFWREMNRANATFHIGLNFPGHLAEGFQPFLSHIPELTAQGMTKWQAVKAIGQAQKEVFRMYGKIVKEKVWKPADVQVTAKGKTYDGIPAMWYRANVDKIGKAAATEIMDMLSDNISRVQRAPLAELFEATGKEQRKLNDIMEGNNFQTAAEALAAPVHKYQQSVLGLYSNFTQHNGLLALIPAYRQGRSNGMTHEQAKLEAARFDLATNNSGGRLERPEMFGELGSAGHVVYALSSYVRGRFAQLATYYKHGWSEHFAGEEARLTPKQRENARAAFKNMILAQVGAAGILGLPFVGAGIALMEQMLDEDLKGKMLKGLDDLLGDPILTRVASHGAASAFAESAGIPADLHSRFALSSFLGVNSYDGVSAKSFLGPMVSMANSLWNMGGSLAKGEGVVNALAKGGPGGVRRFAEALTDQFRQENPDMNMTASALGFRSAEMVKRKEWEGIVRNQEIEANAKRKLAAEEIRKSMRLGSAAARKTMMEQAVKLLPETKNPQERQVALKGIVQGLTSRVQQMMRDEVGMVDYQEVPSGAVRPQAMQVAQAMGMRQEDPMALARALAGQQARGMLGGRISQPAIQTAARKQAQWDPFNVGY